VYAKQYTGYDTKVMATYSICFILAAVLIGQTSTVAEDALIQNNCVPRHDVLLYSVANHTCIYAHYISWKR